jgi:hypothetical protein
MRVPRLAGAIAALALFFPATLSADIGIGPRLAFVRVDSETSDRYTGGVLRAELSPRTAVELAIDWRSVINQDLTERVRDYPFQGSLLLYPVRTRLAPYLLGGVGWYSQRVETLGETKEVLDSVTTRRFGYHAGFGGELRLGRRAAIHVDYRYTFIGFGDDDEAVDGEEEDSGGFRVPLLGSLADRVGLSHDGSMWTAGLTLYF